MIYPSQQAHSISITSQSDRGLKILYYKDITFLFYSQQETYLVYFLRHIDFFGAEFYNAIDWET